MSTKDKKNIDKKNRYYLLMPFLIFLFAFVLDKQFFIWTFPDTFLRTASFVSYEHKNDLLIELGAYLQNPDRKKTVVMFGNSRTTHFDNAWIEKNFPEYILFNFSVPGGTPDYYLYMMEQFQKESIKPDYIYFAVTPQGFNASPSIAMDEVMLEGLPISFVIRYFYNYKADHLTNYIAKKLFWVYQYRPKMNVIEQRLKKKSRKARIFRTFLARERMQLIHERGSINVGFKGKPDQNNDFLKHTAQGTWRDFLANFKANQGQINFLKKTLAIARDLNIPNAMLWVKVGPNLRNFKDSRKIIVQNNQKITIREFFVPLCTKLAAEYSSKFLDLNYAIKSECDYFTDSSHMSGWCFPEFTKIILSQIKTNP